jgi:LEA14-like dessication related protein
MSRKRVVLVAGIVVLVVGALTVLGVLGIPGVVAVENRFGGVNASATVVETDLVVENPNPVGISLGGVTVDYTVRMNDIPMANGTKDGVAVGAGNTTVETTTLLYNERIPGWWVSHVRDGERTDLAVDARVRSSTLGQSVSTTPATREIETDVLSAVNSDRTRPINASRLPVSDPVLYVNETRAEWGAVTESETPIRMAFVVYNPRPYPVPVSKLGYDVTMNDVAVGEAATEKSVVIPPESTRTVEATTTIRTDRLDEWWVTHVERNQVTTLRLDFYVRVDLSAVGAGSIRVPLEPYTTTIETDVFGTKPETGTDQGTATPTATASATERPIPGGTPGTTGTPTATRTDATETAGDVIDAPTETPAPTTTTDDGGILDL